MTPSQYRKGTFVNEKKSKSMNSLPNFCSFCSSVFSASHRHFFVYLSSIKGCLYPAVQSIEWCGTKKIQSEFESLNDTIENTLAAFDSNPAVKSYFSNDPAQHMEQLQQLRTIKNEWLSFKNPSNDRLRCIDLWRKWKNFCRKRHAHCRICRFFFQSAIAQRVNERAADTQMLLHTTDWLFAIRKHPASSLSKTEKYIESRLRICCFIDLIQATSESFSICSKSWDIEDLLHERRTDDHRIKWRKYNWEPINDFQKLTVGETTISNGQQLTRLPLYRQDCTLLSQVDLHSLSNQMGVIFPIILYNIVTLAFAGSLVFMYLDRHTKSIYRLIDSLKRLEEDGLKATVPVQGSHEVNC